VHHKFTGDRMVEYSMLPVGVLHCGREGGMLATLKLKMFYVPV
jgi:hypothetical protein